jgi:hypothetical protein
MLIIGILSFQVKGQAVDVPFTIFPPDPEESESFGLICEMGHDVSVYDDLYESDYRNDTNNVDSGLGSLQIIGIGLKTGGQENGTEEGKKGKMEDTLLEDVMELNNVLVNVSNELEDDGQCLRSLKTNFLGRFQQKMGEIKTLLTLLKRGQLDDTRFRFGAKLIRYLRNMLYAQRDLLKMTNLSKYTFAPVNRQRCREFHHVAYGSMDTNMRFVITTADLMLSMLKQMKKGDDSAVCSDSMMSLDSSAPPHLSQVPASSKPLNANTTDIRALPTLMPVQQGIREASFKNPDFIDSIDNSVDNKRKRSMVSSDSSDSSVSQSNISKCLSVTMEVQNITPPGGKIRQQKKRICQVDVVPSRSADWRNELMEKGAVTSTPKRQAQAASSQKGKRLETLASVEEETNLKKEGSEVLYSQLEEAQYRQGHEYARQLNCDCVDDQALRRMGGQTLLQASPPDSDTYYKSSRTQGKITMHTSTREVDHKENSSTKKLNIETGTGGCGQWSFDVTPMTSSLHQRLGAQDVITSAVASGLQVGEGNVALSVTPVSPKDGNKPHSIKELMKEKRWWFFETTRAVAQLSEAKETVHGRYFSPDTDVVASQDGKKYRRTATREEITGIARPNWKKSSLRNAVSGSNVGNVTPKRQSNNREEGERDGNKDNVRYRYDSGTPVGRSPSPANANGKRERSGCSHNSSMTNDGWIIDHGTATNVKSNSVEKVDSSTQTKPAETVAHIFPSPQPGLHVKDTRIGESWKKYTPSERLDLLNSKHGSPFRVGNTPAAKNGQPVPDKFRCAPVPYKKAGDVVREYPVAHLCPVFKPGSPCLHTFRQSPTCPSKNRLERPLEGHNQQDDHDLHCDELVSYLNLAAESSENLSKSTIETTATNTKTSLSDSNSWALSKLADLHYEGALTSGSDPKKTPIKHRRRSSTSSCANGSAMDIRENMNVKSSNNIKDQEHSNVKKNLSSSFEQVHSVQNSNG